MERELNNLILYMILCMGVESVDFDKDGVPIVKMQEPNMKGIAIDVKPFDAGKTKKE